MSQFDEVVASPEWAFTLAGSLEQQFGDDRILTVGSVRASIADVLGEQPSRAIALQFTSPDGRRATIALVAVAAFAEALERAASDEILLTSCAGALDAAARAIGEQAVVDVEIDAAREVEPELAIDDEEDAELVVYPVLDGGNPVAGLVLAIGRAAGTPASNGATFQSDVSATDASPAHSTNGSFVLADVEMGVTAELGRCRMTVRELLSITPGAVIDLDRAAGAPVDVLVNGTLIARGEVVVIDEEFGIRISELIPQPAAAR
jgi:flagellar motor switch protein FliN/FliY